MPVLFLIPIFSLLIVVHGAPEEPIAEYPSICDVIITTPDGMELGASGQTELEFNTVYSFSARIQLDDAWGAPQNIVHDIPEGYEISWECNFGAFDNETVNTNCANWTSPSQPGDVIITAVLKNPSDQGAPAYIKNFRVWLGVSDFAADYASDHIVVMFQPWCTEECVQSWVNEWPSNGEYRRLGEMTNTYVIGIDPEVDILDAVNEITWWTSVQTAEPDFIVELMESGMSFDLETGEWGSV